MFSIQGVDLLLVIAYGDTASFSVTIQNPGQDGTEASVKYYRWREAKRMVASKRPECQFGAMVHRHIITERIPLIQYLAQFFVADVKEAELKLSYIT